MIIAEQKSLEEMKRLIGQADNILVLGCGTCVTHCPSGAITPGYATDAQIEAMLSVILAK